MSEQKKIAVNLNVRVNVGNYQHIEKTVYSEKVITYESEEEMVEKEDELTNQALNNLVRNMRKIPERLGKKGEAVQDVEDKIVNVIPEWLGEDTIPNIANQAKKDHDAELAVQKDEHDQQQEKIDTPLEEIDPSIASGSDAETEPSEPSVEVEDDFTFDPDPEPEPKPKPKEDSKEETKEDSELKDVFDGSDDDDIDDIFS